MVLYNIKNDSIEKILKNLYFKYQTSFIITGIKKNKKEINDYLIKDNEIFKFKSSIINNINTHGTGCVFSTSLCVYLAKGFSEEISIKKSKKKF